MLLAGPCGHDVKYGNAEAVFRQIDIQPTNETCTWYRTVPRAAHRVAGEDRDSILLFGRVRRLDVWQSHLLHRGAQSLAGPGAEFSDGNQIGVVGGDFLNDGRQAGAATMLDVPGNEFHGVS